ncbi:hypothetical protein CAPTEDRAFT_218835 [Capitella teleta]|uniref:Uncharacterized protein n=1 Tax=Capitella teleta TaxID=283909 RepID=R7V7D7_CAPTE|nr:hypothetical protein CAPTEDRAFT_218835 [Capitella teleta]|eukprot:ELU14479.1 hypothetical protein CAPTEDRAFT_218835 [Capitella teleta]
MSSLYDLKWHFHGSSVKHLPARCSDYIKRLRLKFEFPTTTQYSLKPVDDIVMPMQLPVVISKVMTSEMTSEAPIDLSIRVSQEDRPLDLSVKTDRSSPVSPSPPKKVYSQPARDTSYSPDGLMNGSFKDWMATGHMNSYSPFSARSVPFFSYPAMHVPWCFRLDISPSFYMAQNKDEINASKPPVNVAGSTLLMSGGSMLSRTNVEKTDLMQEDSLNGKLKSMTSSRRKRKHRNSPSPNNQNGGALQESAMKDDRSISGGPRVNFSVMSGGGLVNGDTEIKSHPDTLCNCHGGRKNSGLLLCPVHKVQLPKLSIPNDPKDSSWISAYVSTLRKDVKR